MPKFLARGDYSQIEARVLPWLAGAEHVLDAFRAYDTITGWTEKNGKRVPLRAGPDLYKITAAGTYGKPVDQVTDAERQSGKVQLLALGFAGGVSALQVMARAYDLKIPMHPRLEDGTPDRDIKPEAGTDLWMVERWRAANPEIAGRDPAGLWLLMEMAAIECMANAPGTVYPVGKLQFQRSAKCIALRLPSGRKVAYWSPKLKHVRNAKTGKERLAVVVRGENSVTHRWDEFTMYGGLWAQNATQATARDVMRDALLSMEADGLNPVLTVHDEAICAIEAATAEDAANMVENCMLASRPWTKGLPVACDASAHWRYQKA